MAKLEYVKCDLFKYIKTINKPTIIAHVCNNRGKWGAGFVIPLEKNYPKAKEKYIKYYYCYGLGETQLVQVEKDIAVANMIAQTLGGKRPLYYNHLSSCMDRVAEIISADEIIICPKFGSGLAGGNWNFIEELIQDCWIRRDIEVKVCYL